MRLTIVAVLSTVLLQGVAFAEDRIELENSTVVGNAESPKALFIAPWRQVVSGEVAGLKVETLLDEELAPIDREHFNQQVDLYHIVNSDTVSR